MLSCSSPPWQEEPVPADVPCICMTGPATVIRQSVITGDHRIRTNEYHQWHAGRHNVMSADTWNCHQNTERPLLVKTVIPIYAIIGMLCRNYHKKICHYVCVCTNWDTHSIDDEFCFLWNVRIFSQVEKCFCRPIIKLILSLINYSSLSHGKPSSYNQCIFISDWHLPR